jgi:hypothetical protein
MSGYMLEMEKKSKKKSRESRNDEHKKYHAAPVFLGV